MKLTKKKTYYHYHVKQKKNVFYVDKKNIIDVSVD